jgi:hypothetical protein
VGGAFCYQNGGQGCDRSDISQVFDVDDILICNGNITDGTLLNVLYSSNRQKLFWNLRPLSRRPLAS